jgi:hypothetical protein
MRLVRDALDTLTLPDAVTGVSLRVESVTGNDGSQGDLFDRGFASAPLVEEALLELTDDQGDVVVVPRNSAHPLIEERTRWVAEMKVEGTTYQAAKPSSASIRLQLLTPPRVVTVSTAARRDHDVPVRYLDDNEWHDIVEVAGPDRVSGGQWASSYAREYFRCVREDGTMVWLFHGASESTDWFLHGWWD